MNTEEADKTSQPCLITGVDEGMWMQNMGATAWTQ